MKKNKYFIIFILLIAAFLRFYQLGVNPPSLTWDEVAWGYNAYALGTDGRDEFGRFLPYDYLESFGDFKPPMYAYLDIIPVKIFGLNEFSTRFPSAFFGVLTVLISYFLTLRIFYKSEYSKYYALLTSFILAISPWHVMLSRAAFEANVATFFLVLGVYLFLYALQKKPLIISLSAVSFVFSMYTFNTSRIVAPLLVVLLVFGFWKSILKIKKQIIFAAVVGLVVLLPLMPFLLSDQAKLRFKEVNIFTDSNIVKTSNQEILNDNNVWWSNIIHNRRVGYSLSYLQHYFDNLSFDFLFIKGDGNPKFSLQSVGQMYLWEFPFFIAGIIFLFRKREANWWILPAWLILGIVPAATARETPHALRIETTLPTFQLFVAYGLVNVFISTKGKLFKISFKKALILAVGLAALFNFTYFWEDYSRHYAKKFAGEWQYGYEDAVKYINSVKDDYDTIYMTSSLGRPYMYLLFYEKYNPKLFRQQAKIERDAFGFVNISKIDKYYFDYKMAKESKKHGLYIVSPPDVPKSANIKRTFYLPDNTIVLVAYEE